MTRVRMILAVAVKESRELLRDPVTLGVAVVLPVLLLFIFGYALRLDVREVPAAVVDLDGTAASRGYAALFDRAEEFEIVSRSTDAADVERLLMENRARIVLLIPEGFGRALAKGDVARVQTLVDGSFSATARVIAGFADALAASFVRDGAAQQGPAGVEIRIWYNPAMESTTSVVPGLFGVILMTFPPLLTALAVVREKERGTMQQILISPLPPWSFVLGKLGPYALLAFADVMLVLAAGMFLFAIPLEGSSLFLVLASVLYVLSTLGIGLFVSAITKTQVAALLLVLVLTFMPAFMFSGFLYPIFTMPTALQYYTYVFPGRYFVSLCRGIFLKGVGLGVLWNDIVILAIYAGLMVAVASWRLRLRAA